MIQPDTIKTQKIASFFSLAFGLVCIILTISQLYTFLNQEPQQTNDSIRPPPPKDDFFRGMPKDSPFMLLFFIIGAVISIVTGLMLYSNTHKVQKKEIKHTVLDEMLLPEEKQVVKLLEENKGELTQSELVKKSSLGKLKVSRIVKKLEASNIIKKYPYGLTNKIKLNSDKTE